MHPPPPLKKYQTNTLLLLFLLPLSLSELKLDLNFNVVAGELTSQGIVGGAALDFDKSSTVCVVLTVKFAG